MSNPRDHCTLLRRVAFALMSMCVLAGCADKAPSGPTSVAAVTPAASQNDAVGQARKTDLPAVASADRAVLSSSETGKSVEITNVDRVRRLAGVLKPAEVPPSSGEEAMTVRFYQGPTLLREVWVYQDGEWGFRRPGTSWTTGQSGELVRLIQQELGGDPAAR